MKRIGVSLFFCLFLFLGANIQAVSARPFSWHEFDTGVGANWMKGHFGGTCEAEQNLWCNSDWIFDCNSDFTNSRHHEFIYDCCDQAGNDKGTDASDAAPVPEPATLLLFGAGLLGYAGARRKR